MNLSVMHAGRGLRSFAAQLSRPISNARPAAATMSRGRCRPSPAKAQAAGAAHAVEVRARAAIIECFWADAMRPPFCYLETDPM